MGRNRRKITGLLNWYELYSVNSTAPNKLRRKGTFQRFLCNDEQFDVIHTAHLSAYHGARGYHAQQNKILVR